MEKTLTQKSKFLSLILRHRPEVIGLTLDLNGWANVQDLISLAPEFTLDSLKEIVETCEKKRYTLDLENMKIRANQGHSIDVDLQLEAIQPPEFLFHGTANHFLPSILTNGLKKQARHHVHMTENKDMALKTGRRHGSGVVLVISSGEMFQKGMLFYKSANNVWLTDFVPPNFIEEMN